jgi:UDP-2,3-diacylglucosamine pyrophosphatase LpxH
MSHAKVLTALQQFCPNIAGRPESGVSLVSRFARSDLGLAGAGTFVFTTDWHLVPDGTQDEWPEGRVCVHPPERLMGLVTALGGINPRPAIVHLGDLIDIWRTLTAADSVKARVDAVLQDYDAVEALAGLNCKFFTGNHDASIRDGAPPWLGAALNSALRLPGDQVTGVYKQCLGLMHGHQYSGIEQIPDEIKEWGVRREHRNPAAVSTVRTNPAPGPDAYIVEGTGEGTHDDEFLNPALHPGGLLPLDKDTLGRAVAFQTQNTPFPGSSPNYDISNAIETFYPMARDRCWIMSTEKERISVLVIGHTHRPRIVYGIRQDGSLFVLMDCGSWRGSKKLSRRMPGSVLNAQIGVIAENDLRIYQLTF